MRNELEKGYKLIFPEKKEGYIIKDVLGRGASCLVYLAETRDGYHVRYSIIKEFNPIQLDLERDCSGALIVPQEKKEQYLSLMARFKVGYEKQQQIRIISDLTNTTSNIQGIYHTNNTEYIEMTYFNGETYAVQSEKSLYDFFRRMKALTQVIANYHNAGFLHLDIKPDNVYILPETPEMVMLFDFDSVIEKDAIVGSTPLSYTKDWASIEQIDLKRRNEICEATDLFAVGEMVFYFFFSRHSDISERRSFSKYSFDYNSSLLEGVNPTIVGHLNDLLHRTICNVVKNRYQNAQELIDKLDTLIALSNPNIPFLKTNIPATAGFFIGRDDEIDCIHTRLQQTETLFVSGIGGIGKSELVKQYARKYVNNYDAIIYAPFISDVFTLITDDTSLPICNFKQFPEEKAEEYYARKLRKLKELCNEKVLIVIDNFDDEKELETLLGFNCKMIFTTRCDFSNIYEQMNVNALKDRKHIKDIFNNFYVKAISAEEKEIVDEIIDIVEGHTMTVELLAKQMMVGRVTPKQMLDRLNSGGVADSGKETIRIAKDEHLKTGNAYSHIQALFNLSELNEDEIYILANLSIIPHTGISAALFCQWCEISNYDVINSLVDEGWVRIDKERDYISLHTLISDVVINFISLKDSFEYIILKQTVDHPEQVATTTSPEESKERMYLLREIEKKFLYYNVEKEYIIDFLYQMGLLNWRCGCLGEAILCNRRALDIFVKNNSTDSYRFFELYFSLGILYKAQNDYSEAEQIFLHITKTILNKHKNSYKEIAEVYQECGYVYLEQGMYKKALKHFKHAISMYLKIKKENTLEYAYICSCIGALYEEIKNFSKAKKYYYVQLNITKSILGESNVEIANIYQTIADIHRKLNEDSDKKICEKKALYIYSKKEMDSNKIETYKKLASLYSEEKKYVESVRYYKKALELTIRLYGEENINSAWIYNQIAYEFDNVGDIESTEKFLLKALRIFERIHDNNHSDLARQYADIASVYERQDDYKKAEKYLCKSLEISKKIYGLNNVFVGNIFSLLASVCEKQDKYAEAIGYYENAMYTWKNSKVGDSENIKYVEKKLRKLQRKVNSG